MVRTNPITPDTRVQLVSMMIAHRRHYGLVSTLSRQYGVARQTLYTWEKQAQHALLACFSPAPAPGAAPSSLSREILTLWVNGHATVRGIQTCLRTLLQKDISIGTIIAILHQAQERALNWLGLHHPQTIRALALDEIFTTNRRGAILNGVDVHSGAVWATTGPHPVDQDSWTLVLWDLQERGLRWSRVVCDDGKPMAAACHTATPTLPIQLDQWHQWQECARVQGRLDRHLGELIAQTPTVERQAARIAAGRPPQGRHPKTDLAAHGQDVALAKRLAADVAFLTQELRRLLDAVVVDHRGVLEATSRQEDLDATLELLTAVAEDARGPQANDVRRLAKQIRARLPQLTTFVAQVSQVQTDLLSVLPMGHQELLAWAWQRRAALGWTSQAIVAAVPPDWQAGARVLLATWDDAVRVSSAVERWHSILRPHLAVHRTLTNGALALLAVWHNHRVYSRGVHQGQNPLQLSGMTDTPTDWLVALGYPLPEPEGVPEPMLALALVV